MSVGCYVRVSTSGQNKAGQRREINKWLRGAGIDRKSVKWFEDESTGSNLDRPGFEALQAAIFAGEVRTVVCFKLDRLSRSLHEGIQVLHDWCEAGVRTVSVTQALDMNGSVGRLVAALLLGVAEMEQETRRERQAAGIEVAKAKGKYKGRVVGTTKSSPRRAKQLQDRGLTLTEIGQALGVSRRTAARYLASVR